MLSSYECGYFGKRKSAFSYVNTQEFQKRYKKVLQKVDPAFTIPFPIQKNASAFFPEKDFEFRYFPGIFYFQARNISRFSKIQKK
jgi:hypothetical protein